MAIGVFATLVITVVASLFPGELKEHFGWQAWVVLVSTALAVWGQVSPMVAGKPALTLANVDDIARELRYGIMLRTLQSASQVGTWHKAFELLAKTVERQISAVLGYEQDDWVACNLMVLLPADASAQQISSLSKAETEWPYEPKDEGVEDGKVQAVLAMVGRGVASRDYPWINLHIPENGRRALPGGPHVIHRLSHALKNDPSASKMIYEYVPYPARVEKTTFNSGLDTDAKNAFASYFMKYNAHVKSFLSIGLSCDGKEIGVLNIDGIEEDFLSDPVVRALAISLLWPYAEIATSFACMLRERKEVTRVEKAKATGSA